MGGRCEGGRDQGQGGDDDKEGAWECRDLAGGSWRRRTNLESILCCSWGWSMEIMRLVGNNCSFK